MSASGNFTFSLLQLDDQAYDFKGSMSPFKGLKLILEKLNQEGTYSDGDVIIGTVTFNLKRATKVKSISVKFKGDAKVGWTEEYGDNEVSFSGHEQYIKIKEYLIAKTAQGMVLPQGVHNLGFELKIPHGVLPSSFNGSNGKIVYVIEAKISRRWWWSSSVKTEIYFVSKIFPQIQQAMRPLSGFVVKEVGTFSKGQLQLCASVNRGICFPGDTLSAFAKISNTSSKDVKPKFSLHQKIVYSVGKHTKTCESTILKIVGDKMKPSAAVTVPCEVEIPDNALYTLQNCEIISVQYYLKVYLDISFAFDPEVVIPVLVVPSDLVKDLLGEDVGSKWASCNAN